MLAGVHASARVWEALRQLVVAWPTLKNGHDGLFQQTVSLEVVLQRSDPTPDRVVATEVLGLQRRGTRFYCGLRN